MAEQGCSVKRAFVPPILSGVAGGGTSSAQRAVELRTEPDKEIDAGGTRAGCVWELRRRPPEIVLCGARVDFLAPTRCHAGA